MIVVISHDSVRSSIVLCCCMLFRVLFSYSIVFTGLIMINIRFRGILVLQDNYYLYYFDNREKVQENLRKVK